MPSSNANPHDDQVNFFIDQEKFTATSPITPRRIITEFAKEDPAVTTLLLIHGNDRTKLEDIDTPYPVKNGAHFTTLHRGPTTVS